jgi:hypothetical protein
VSDRKEFTAMTHTGFTEAESEFVRNERVVRFNSSDETGMIHSVPVCLTFDGNNFFIHARRHYGITKNDAFRLE